MNLPVVVLAVAALMSQTEAPQDFGDLAGKSYPSNPSEASVEVLVGEQWRTIEIYRDNPAGGKGPNSYFHEPPFAFVTNSSPPDGMPEIVQRVIADTRGGLVYLQFRVVLSSESLRIACRDALIEQDEKWLNEHNISPDEIDIRQWPVENVTMECVRLTDGSVIAISGHQSARRKVDTLDVTMGFSFTQLDDLLKGLENDTVRFNFHYTYTGSRTVSGEAATRISRSVAAVFAQELKSEQYGKEAPLFQGQSDKALRRAIETVATSIRAEHKDLVPVLQAQLSDAVAPLLEQTTLSFEDLRTNPDYMAAFARYIVPRLHEVVTTDARLSRVKDASASSTGFDLSTGLLDFGLALSGQEVRALEEVTGTQFQQTERETWYQPHAVHVQTLKDIEDSAMLSTRVEAFLALGSGLIARSTFDNEPTFAEDILSSASGVSRPAIYPGVFQGTVLSTISTITPQGWVPMDGTYIYPSADWVPQELWGKPVVAAGALRASLDPAQIGSILEDELPDSIAIEAFQIDTSFSATIPVDRRQHHQPGQFPHVANNQVFPGSLEILLLKSSAISGSGTGTVPAQTLELPPDPQPRGLAVRFIMRCDECEAISAEPNAESSGG